MERQYREISEISEDTPDIEFIELQVYEKVLGASAKRDYLTNAMKLALLLAIG